MIRHKELKGFTKTLVKAAQTENIRIALDKRAFEFWSVANEEWEIEDGIYEIVVAASVSDEKLSVKVGIKGGKITLLQ